MAQDDLMTGDLRWRKARRSANNGACVEVAPASEQVFVRDSKDQDGLVMRYPACAWRLFVTDVKAGRLNSGQLSG